MAHAYNMTYQEALNRASSFLTDANKEADIAKWLLWDLKDWNLTNWIAHRLEAISEEVYDNYMRAIQRIITEDYPWQYLAGKAWFYGRPFKVTTETLIPRQETEDLVDQLLVEVKENHYRTILDVGTGSGIIAITAALETACQVAGTDISTGAVAVARENAQKLQATVSWTVGDLLQPLGNKCFDCIVTNPPYIGQNERDVMGTDVLKNEPELALFAANDGYAIYEQIIQQLPDYLNDGGLFLAEIGYQQGEQLQTLFADSFKKSEIEIIKDYTGNDRILKMHYKKG